MKMRTGFILGTALVAIVLSGCNKTQETAGTASGTTEQPRTGSTRANELAVTKRVEAALAQDEILKGFGITVQTQKGDVLLKGVLDDRRQIDHAKQLVRGIEGVHTLHDELSLKN